MRGIWLLLAIISGAIWLGFLLHTSSGDNLALGKYSTAYLIIIITATAAWLSFLWWSWRQQDAMAQKFRGLLVSVLLTVVLAMLTLPSAYIYLHNQSLDKDLLVPLSPQAHAFFQYDVAPDIPLSLDNGTIRILTLGGSTTYGSQLERHEAYPAVLKRILQQRHPDTPIKILNAGFPGIPAKSLYIPCHRKT